MNNWDINDEANEIEALTASWRWVDDEIVYIEAENDEFIPQLE